MKSMKRKEDDVRTVCVLLFLIHLLLSDLLCRTHYPYTHDSTPLGLVLPYQIGQYVSIYLFFIFNHEE